MFDRCENEDLPCESSSHQLSSKPTTEPDRLVTVGADGDYLAHKTRNADCATLAALTLSGEMVTATRLAHQNRPEPIPDLIRDLLPHSVALDRFG